MPLDIMSAFSNDPPQLDFIWPGFVAGTVGALIAPGATGKSFWALQAAMSVACNAPGGDTVRISPRHNGPVVYMAAEDPEAALIQRVHAIGKHLNPQARQAIAENLAIEPILGKRLDVMSNAGIELLLNKCEGTRLLVLDTLNRVHQLDENSNGDMARLVSRLEYVAAQSGAAVLYLHHVSKGSAQNNLVDKQQAARGASVLTDNARWCGYVAKMSPKQAEHFSDRTYDKKAIGQEKRGFFVRFGISKQNYEMTPTEQWYRRGEGGVLLPVELVKAEQEEEQDDKVNRRKSHGF